MRDHRYPNLAALSQNSVPDAVDGLLEFGSGRGSDLVQVWFGGAAHEQEVLFRHTAHDRIAVEQFGRLADRSDSRPQRALFQNVDETPGSAERYHYVDIAIAACSDCRLRPQQDKIIARRVRDAGCREHI